LEIISTALIDIFSKTRLLSSRDHIDRDVSEKRYVNVSCMPFVNKENLDKRS